jgi:hypothetical protein
MGRLYKEGSDRPVLLLDTGVIKLVFKKRRLQCNDYYSCFMFCLSRGWIKKWRHCFLTWFALTLRGSVAGWQWNFLVTHPPTSTIVYAAMFHLWSLIFLRNASFGSFFSDIGFFQIPSHSSSKQIIRGTSHSKVVQGHGDTMAGMHFCYKCGKMYSWKANLRRHLRLECGKRPQLQCPHCPYITKRKSSLNRHVGSRHVTWY